MLRLMGFGSGLNNRYLRDCSKRNLIHMLSVTLRVCVLSGFLISSTYASGSADDFMRVSISHLFDNVNKFECEGSERTAICTIDHYELDNTGGFVLRDYRHTLDYKDSRVIERVSGKVDVPSNYDLKVFIPKSFECSDFTQIHNEKKQVNEQLICTINSDSYKLNIRLRARANSSLFSNVNSLSLLQKSTAFLDKMLENLASVSDRDQFVEKMLSFNNILNNIDVNLYGIDIAITKPELPQKIYEHVFADMIDDSSEASEYAVKRYNQLAHTLYNSGVGYIYGNVIGYIWGSDEIDKRTKESLTKLFVTLRDSAMLGSNIHTVYITIVNRTNKGFNLGRAFEKVMQETHNFREFDRDRAGQALNLFDGSIFNRYRIEVGTTRLKQRN